MDSEATGAASADGWPVPRVFERDSVFRPENLLREGRRQRGLLDVPVPAVCVLDPDGDIVRYLTATGAGRRHQGWACYHTDMWCVDVTGPTGPVTIGVVGMAVGASFAVLVAEQLHASGAAQVISITSAGQLTAPAEPPYFLLITDSLRDEGTSGHYLPPATWVGAPGRLLGQLLPRLSDLPEAVLTGTSWTTDAPYRETQPAIEAATAAGADCVEMESAGLYAYAEARGRDVLCLAHVTNTMATDGDDFEKGDANGATAALRMAAAVADIVRTNKSDDEPTQ